MNKLVCEHDDSLVIVLVKATSHRDVCVLERCMAWYY